MKKRRRKKGSRKWIQKARQRMERKGTIGTFRAAAKRAGMSTREFARHVLANKHKYSKKMRMKANFVRNVLK